MGRALESRDISAFHLPFTWSWRLTKKCILSDVWRDMTIASLKKSLHILLSPDFFALPSLLRDVQQLCVKIGCSSGDFEKFLVYKSTAADFGARTKMSSVKGLFFLLSGVVTTSLELRYIMHYHLSEELSETSVICFGARFGQAFSHDWHMVTNSHTHIHAYIKSAVNLKHMSGETASN